VTLSISNTAALDACDAIVDLCEAGTAASFALLVIYEGSVPADADTALGGGNNVLASLTMSNPAFGAADPMTASTPATATANSITDDASADAGGEASFFRILDLDATPVIQGAVSTSGAELNLNTTTIVATGRITITSLTVTMPVS